MDDQRKVFFTGLTELKSLGLQRGAVAHLENARGTRLRVETGTIWITNEHCRDDVLVATGEAYTLERDGTTFVSSLGKRFALVTLEPRAPVPLAPAPAWIERLDRFWCGLFAEHEPARSYL
jgi:hypothetical protein